MSAPVRISGLLLGWRIILEELGYCLVEILLFFVWILGGIQCFGGRSFPDELLAGLVINIKSQRSDLKRRARGRSHAASHAPAHAASVSVPLLFLADRNLVGDEKVGCVAVGFGESLRRELRINRLFDLLVHDLVWVFR